MKTWISDYEFTNAARVFTNLLGTKGTVIQGGRTSVGLLLLSRNWTWTETQDLGLC